MNLLKTEKVSRILQEYLKGTNWEKRTENFLAEMAELVGGGRGLKVGET